MQTPSDWGPVRNLHHPLSSKSRFEGHGCSLHLQNQDREPKFGIWVNQRSVNMFNSISGWNPQSGTSSILQNSKSWLEGHGCSLQLQNQDSAKSRNKGVWKTSSHIKMKIKMPNPSQEPSAFSKAPNQDLKDMDVLCTFKIKIESQNSNHGYIKDQRRRFFVALQQRYLAK